MLIRARLPWRSTETRSRLGVASGTGRASKAAGSEPAGVRDPGRGPNTEKGELSMRRILPWSLLLALAVSAPAMAATSVSVGITLGNAPPPPRIMFGSEPRWTAMPTVGVAYYDGPCDYDYFRYGSYFLLYNDRLW